MRYLPHTDEDIRRMLEQIGASGLEDLFESIPERLHLTGPLRLPEPLSEPELAEHVRELASRNDAGALHFLGAGAYPHHVPAAVDSMLRRGEFFTAYTP
ncbi:MAG: glycine dehydrogenase, partial [Deltaproteobacteria bacterium]